MNLRDLEYLVALAEHRHFGKAAAACYVSQPTLSTQLKKLESQLGVPLIERGARSVLLTTAGEHVVARARTILTDAQDIRSIAQQAQDPRSGTVRLGIFPTLAPYLLPHVVGSLHRHLPELEVLWVESKTNELIDALAAGSLDAAILALPVADESVHAEPLFREDFVLAVPSEHPLADGHRPVVAADLAGADVLLLQDGHCLRDQALAVCHSVGAGEREGFRATSLETLRHMVAAGVGITLLPRLAVSPPVPAYRGISLLEFAEPAPHRDIALVWRRTSVLAPLLPEIAAIVADLPRELVRALDQSSPAR